MQQVTIKEFKIARAKFEQTAQEVADALDVARNTVYEVIKYPNKNPELHRKIAEYCKTGEVTAEKVEL